MERSKGSGWRRAPAEAPGLPGRFVAVSATKNRASRRLDFHLAGENRRDTMLAIAILDARYAVLVTVLLVERRFTGFLELALLEAAP